MAESLSTSGGFKDGGLNFCCGLATSSYMLMLNCLALFKMLINSVRYYDSLFQFTSLTILNNNQPSEVYFRIYC